MIDLLTLIMKLTEEGEFQALAQNPRVQFGTPVDPLLGATLLPKRTVTENLFRDTDITFRTVIALDGSRYSPAQLRGSGALIGEMLVEVGNQDIAREFTGREYDALLKLLAQNVEMDAAITILNWVDQTIVRALEEIIERQRWQALLHGTVTREGDNGRKEEVEYPKPAGHRIVAAQSWDNAAVDPIEDLIVLADVLRDKGYEVNRIITSRQVASVMARNENVRKRAGSSNLEIDASGQLSARYGRVTRDGINNTLAADGLPPIEVYDRRYNTLQGTEYFFDRDTVFMAATTGRNEQVALDPDGEELEMMNDVLGYVADGIPVGVPTPGRVVRVMPKTNKPPRIEAEGWQATLPVIQTPEGLATLTGILP